MADAKKYLDLEGLSTYDEKIKGFVNDKETSLDAKITAEKNRAEGVEGTLANLSTDAKGSLVAAINEVDSNTDAITTKVGTVPGSVGEVTTNTVVEYVDAKVAAASGAEDIKIGSLDDLTTDVKTNVVAAINEVDANADAAKSAADTAQGEVDALETKVGDIPQGATATTVVGYAAEVAGSVASDLATLEESLADVATSGAAADVSVADTAGKFDGTNVEAVLTELAGMISDAESADAVTVEKSTTVEGVAARYTFKQGGTPIANAVIDIPKDMVVESGEVVTDPEGHPKGTYLKLVLANAEETEIFIDVTTLIEYVTGGETAEIAVVVDPTTHVVTSTVKKIDAAKIVYKAATEEAEEITVKGALNDIYNQIGQGGSVAKQIEDAIGELNQTVSQTGSDKTGLTLEVVETAGKLTSITGSIDTISDAEIENLFKSTPVEEPKDEDEE